MNKKIESKNVMWSYTGHVISYRSCYTVKSWITVRQVLYLLYSVRLNQSGPLMHFVPDWGLYPFSGCPILSGSFVGHAFSSLQSKAAKFPPEQPDKYFRFTIKMTNLVYNSSFRHFYFVDSRLAKMNRLRQTSRIVNYKTDGFKSV